MAVDEQIRRVKELESRIVTTGDSKKYKVHEINEEYQLGDDDEVWIHHYLVETADGNEDFEEIDAEFCAASANAIMPIIAELEKQKRFVVSLESDKQGLTEANIHYVDELGKAKERIAECREKLVLVHGALHGISDTINCDPKFVAQVVHTWEKDLRAFLETF